MKYYKFIIIFIATFISACGFSLAEDVTPPPEYVAPTLQPDLGMLYPEEPPSPALGKEIFLESCTPCHGQEGLGNGPIAARMPVAVPAIGLREISSQSSPADWYQVITLGNPERGMPSFNYLSSQERWDILAYIYSLNISADVISSGTEVFQIYCEACHSAEPGIISSLDFQNQEVMAGITDQSIFRAISEGSGEMRAFSADLSEDDIWNVVAYLRFMTFNLTSPSVTPIYTSIPPIQTVVQESITPQVSEEAATMETDSTETPDQVMGIVTGQVINASGSTSSSPDLEAKLIVYNTTEGQIINTLTTDIAADGSFAFSGISVDSQIAYWVSVDYQGVSYYSELSVFDGTTQNLNLPVVIYEATSNWSNLRLDLVHIAIDELESFLEVSELYVFSNPGSSTVIIETDGTSLPFIKLPAGVVELTSLTPDPSGASFLPAVGGVAVPPSTDAQYGVVASYRIQYDNRFDFTQEFPSNISALSLFVPNGFRIKTDQLKDAGIQEFGGSAFRVYEFSNYPAGILTFTISGHPDGDGSNKFDKDTLVIIIVGLIGISFVGLGLYILFRDRALLKIKDQELVEPSIDSSVNSMDDLLDAIIALDEKLKNGEISRDIHKNRRSQLLEKVKATKFPQKETKK